MALVVKMIDVFVPIMMQGAIRGGRDYLSEQGSSDFIAIGRLHPGVTVPRAQQSIDSCARSRRRHAEERGSEQA